MATTTRSPVQYPPIALKSVSPAKMRVPTLGGKGISVSAVLLGGTWATRTIDVKQVRGGVAAAFASAKQIPAGGGSVSISEAELAGVAEIELITSGTAEAGESYALPTVVYDIEDASVGAVGGLFGSTRLRLGEGPQTQQFDFVPAD